MIWAWLYLLFGFCLAVVFQCIDPQKDNTSLFLRLLTMLLLWPLELMLQFLHFIGRLKE